MPDSCLFFYKPWVFSLQALYLSFSSFSLFTSENFIFSLGSENNEIPTTDTTAKYLW